MASCASSRASGAPEAVVRAAPERVMVHVRARDVEPVGLGIPARIPIGRGQRRQHGLAPMDRAAADLPAAASRCAPSARPATRSAGSPPRRWRSATDRSRSIRSCSGWRSKSQTPLPIRSVVVTLPAASSSLHIVTISRSVSWSPASSTAISALIRSSRGAARRSASARRRYASSSASACATAASSSSVKSGLRPRAWPVGPAFEIVTVHRVDAEHLRDDDHGKRRRERLDQVEPGTPGDALQELVDDLANARRQPLHGSRREGLADERAQASVSRWILEEQAELPEAREDPHVRALVGVARVDGRGAVSQQALDVGRPGEDPAADHLVVVDGLSRTQAREHGIRIGAEDRVQRRQLDAGGNGVRGLVRGLVHHRETSGSAESRWEARSGHRTISHPGAPRE